MLLKFPCSKMQFVGSCTVFLHQFMLGSYALNHNFTSGHVICIVHTSFYPFNIRLKMHTYKWSRAFKYMEYQIICLTPSYLLHNFEVQSVAFSVGSTYSIYLCAEGTPIYVDEVQATSIVNALCRPKRISLIFA